LFFKSSSSNEKYHANALLFHTAGIVLLYYSTQPKGFLE
jgi:hypothetical protein